MAKQINVGVDGVVRTVKEVPISIGGVVKKAQKGVCGVGGVVKTFFEAQNDLILWNGTNLLNGASWWSTNSEHLYYTYTPSNLIGKYLVVVPKTNMTGCCIAVKTNVNTTSHYFSPNGGEYTSAASASGSWSVGKEYLFSLNNVANANIANFHAYIQNAQSGSKTFKDNIQYMAIR